MKYILLLAFIPTTLFSQNKNNTILYEGGLLTQEIIQNYLDKNQKVIQNKVIGTNVRIFIDTIFKKYTILYSDEDEKNMAMIFKFLRNYFPGEQSRDKFYLMEFQEYKFFLVDYLNIYPVFELQISEEELLPNNCTFLYRVKNVKKHIQQ